MIQRRKKEEVGSETAVKPRKGKVNCGHWSVFPLLSPYLDQAKQNHLTSIRTQEAQQIAYQPGVKFLVHTSSFQVVMQLLKLCNVL